MSIIRIKIRKKSKKRSRTQSASLEHLSPEKRRKIDELMLAKMGRGLVEEVRAEEPPIDEALVEEAPHEEVRIEEFPSEVDRVEESPLEEFLIEETQPEEVHVKELPTASEKPVFEPRWEPEVAKKKEMLVEKEAPPERDAPLRKDVSFSKRDKTCKKIIEWGIVGLLIFSPLPAASVHEWSILLIQLTIFALFGTYLLIHHKPKVNPYLSASLKWPSYLFLALFVLIFFQLLPLPGFLVKIISPNAHYIRTLFSPEFADTHFMGLSLIPSHTFREALKLIPYFLLGFLVIKTITEQRQIKRILYVLVGMSVFQALYGFFELYSRNPRILFYEKEYYLDAVTGTFVNRNHLSGYLEMIVPLAIGIVLAQTDFFNLSRLSWREKLVRFWGKGLYVRVLIPASIIVMSLAIIFSKSRSGIFLLLLTFLLFSEVSILYFRKQTKRMRASPRFLKIIFLLITIFALYIGIDGVIKRFSMERFLSEYRSFYWAQTAEIIGDFPVFGSGLGTFPSVYPVYDKTMIPAQFSHAHNDYLEYFSELGILGLIFLFGGIVILLIKSFFIWREISHPQVKALALGGILSITLLLLHSITDFNLHIPANMLLFSVLLSLTAVMAFFKLGENESTGAMRRPGDDCVQALESEEKLATQQQKEWQKFMLEKKKPVSKKVYFLMMVSVGILAVISAAIYWNHHLYSVGKDAEIQAKRIQILKRANAIYPKNDLVHYEMGLANQALGLQDSEFAEVRVTRMQDSSENFERSLKINPLSAYGHLFFGKTQQSLSLFLPVNNKEEEKSQDAQSSDKVAGTLDEEALEEYKKAVMLAAHHKPIYLDVGKILFSHWNELSEEDKNFTKNFLKKLSERIQNEDLVELMQVWALNVKDYSLMDFILPDGIQAYKMYVTLLGEESLSHQERQRYQSKVEAIRFESARKRFKSGENELVYRKIEEAKDHFERSLDILGSVKFYQNLIGKKVIDSDAFMELKKSSYLMSAKCRLMTGQSFMDVESYLQRYVQMEEREAALHELEVFLQNRGILRERISSNLEDLDLIAFQMQLYFKQGRYRGIIDVGRTLDMDYTLLHLAERKIYAQLMHMIGDAFLKQDFLYDAATCYKKALEIDPKNLEMLFSIRDSYERYNDENMTLQLDEMINSILSPRELLIDDLTVQKGKTYSQRMGLNGRRINLKLNFQDTNEEVKPLISVFFNDQVVWENYVADGEISILLKPLAGQNRLVILPVNTDIVLQRIAYQ